MSQHRPDADGVPAPVPASSRAIEHLRLLPLIPRRQPPWLLVDVDGTPAAHQALVWSLREAARREAIVLAVCVMDAPEGDPRQGTARLSPRTQTAVRDQLEAAVLRAVAETSVDGRTRTAILERPVFDALSAAAHGADLVVVGADGKRLLRSAVPRSGLRRVERGA